MHPVTRELAVKRASTDGEPRLVAQGKTIYIVTPRGEIWQVFDSEGPDGEMRAMPKNDMGVWARIFVGAEANSPVRIYRFGIGESRSPSARRLYEQLERAKLGDERAA
jgi:hypothetical protein